jgi:hypothetical protein
VYHTSCRASGSLRTLKPASDNSPSIRDSDRTTEPDESIHRDTDQKHCQWKNGRICRFQSISLGFEW